MKKIISVLLSGALILSTSGFVEYPSSKADSVGSSIYRKATHIGGIKYEGKTYKEEWTDGPYVYEREVAKALVFSVDEEAKYSKGIMSDFSFNIAVPPWMSIERFPHPEVRFYENNKIYEGDRFICGFNNIVIQNGVQNIGAYALSNAINIKKIRANDSVDVDSIKENGDGVIYLPSSVAQIGAHSFANCDNLVSVDLHESVTEIGKGAFYGCRKLEDVTLPNSITTIKERAFDSCLSLSTITIPNSVTRIGDSFDNCDNLESVTILNPNCKIDHGFFSYGLNFILAGECPTIRGYSGSTAEEFAKNYEYLRFEAIDSTYGDVNIDGKVSVADAVAILQYLGNKDKYSLSENAKKNADCFDVGDGITAKDALAIQQLDAKAIDSLPAYSTK